MDRLTAQLLDQLDSLKNRFAAAEQKSLEKILTRLSKLPFVDSGDLLRYHEILLFIAAYPASSRILRTANSELSKFSRRIESLETTGEDLSQLEHPEYSGIAGMSVTP